MPVITDSTGIQPKQTAVDDVLFRFDRDKACTPIFSKELPISKISMRNELDFLAGLRPLERLEFGKRLLINKGTRRQIQIAATDTVKLADVKLPSLAWGEKDGVVTNSERCVSRQRAFLPVPGEARSDWWQLAQVARRMGFDNEFAWTSPAEIFREHAALTAFENNGSRDLDLTACTFIDEKTFAGLKPFQWPQAGQEIKFGTRRYFADGQFFTEDRRARFIPIEPKKDIVDEHLLRLNTGRVRDHWHTMTRTGKSPRLSAHRSEPYCEVHPKDASELHIVEDDLVRLSSEHGDVIVRAKLSDSQQQGSVFVPMHWNDETAANARIDRVIASVVDPHSGQPASKHMPVTLERINMNVHGFAMLRDKPSELNFPYWSIALAKQGWLLEFAESDIRGANELAQSVLHSPSLSCLDETNGIWSFAKFHDDQLLGALYLSTRRVTTSRSWAADQLGRTFSDMSARCLLYTSPSPRDGLLSRMPSSA